MNKLICPLLTPYLNGRFDQDSMHRLLVSTEKFVDIYVPCLSSGEGSKISGNFWDEVVVYVTRNTNKPVFAGILNKHDETKKYMSRASELGCTGVVLPLGLYLPDEVSDLTQLASTLKLKIIFYNSEENIITDVNYICRVCSADAVVGFKDSSSDRVFLAELIKTKPENASWEIYQGMETQISSEDSVDGYFISLANVEPEFCQKLVSKRDTVIWSDVKSYLDKYNLENPTWYVFLKEYLFTESVFSSDEQVNVKA